MSSPLLPESVGALLALDQAWQARLHATLARELCEAAPAGQPAVAPRAGQRKIAAYSRDEAIAAIRTCASEIGRSPTSSAYRDWVKLRVARARRGGRPRPRFPSIDTLYGGFFGSWGEALVAAALDEPALRADRAARVPGPPVPTGSAPSPRMALRALSPEAAAALGLDAGELERLMGVELGALPLSEALRLARELGGSLAWLAGSTTTQGRPPTADAVLDLVRVQELIRESRLTERGILETLGLGLGPWRRMRRGSLEPTAAQVLELAGVLRVDAESLLRKRLRV